MRLFVLLSGPIAVGKSAVATALIDEHRFLSFRSGQYLRDLATKRGYALSRTILQELGDGLDRETDYAWLIDKVVSATIQDLPRHERWLLDSVRKQQQIEHFRERFGGAVLHVHVTAPEAILRARYEHRIADGRQYEGGIPYAVAAIHPNELSSRGLLKSADLVIDLHLNTPQQAAEMICSKLPTETPS